jgi:cell division protein FtsI/penicillin-binding protein 2
LAEKKNDILIRGYLVFAGFVLFGLAIIARVGYLQIAEGEYWKSKKDSLTLSYRSIPPMRGNIYASDGSLLATSLPRYDIHVDLQFSWNEKAKCLMRMWIHSLIVCLNCSRANRRMSIKEF